MQEHAAEPDRRPVHEHELLRHRDRPLLLQRLVHREGLAPAILGRLDLVGDGAYAVIKQRPVDEPRPDVEDVDQVLGQPAEAPDLVGVDDPRRVIVEQAAIEVDDAADKGRREDADAAIVQQVDALRRAVAIGEDGVVAEMRIAMDHAEAAEGRPPGREHRRGEPVALLQAMLLVGGDLVALQPVHGQQPRRRQRRPHRRDPHQRLARQHRRIERRMLGLAPVIQFLADAGADLLRHLARVDRRVHAPVHGKQHRELLEVGLHGGLHVRILQLAGQRRAGQIGGPMHLPQRRGGRRAQLERAEFLAPVGAELGLHPTLDEGRPHRRRVALQLGEFLRIFGRQGVRDGRHQLGDLHDRPLQAAKGLGQRSRIGAPGLIGPEQAASGHAGGDAANIGPDPRIARDPGGHAVSFNIAIGHARDMGLGNRMSMDPRGAATDRGSSAPAPPR